MYKEFLANCFDLLSIQIMIYGSIVYYCNALYYCFISVILSLNPIILKGIEYIGLWIGCHTFTIILYAANGNFSINNQFVTDYSEYFYD